MNPLLGLMEVFHLDMQPHYTMVELSTIVGLVGFKRWIVIYLKSACHVMPLLCVCHMLTVSVKIVG